MKVLILYCVIFMMYAFLLGCPKDKNLSHNTEARTLFSELSTSEQHTCSLKENGVINCWGSIETYLQPTYQEHRYVSISSGPGSLCAIDDEKTVHCWGSESDILHGYRQEGIREVAVARQHICTINLEQKVFCYGYGMEEPAIPNLVKDKSIHEISSSGDYFCGRDEKKDFICWGPDVLHVNNWLKTINNHEDIRKMSAKRQMICVLFNGGKIKCNDERVEVYGELFKDIEVGVGFFCGILQRDNSVVCRTSAEKMIWEELKGSEIKLLSAGHYLCALHQNNKIICLGETPTRVRLVPPD